MAVWSWKCRARRNTRCAERLKACMGVGNDSLSYQVSVHVGNFDVDEGQYEGPLPGVVVVAAWSLGTAASARFERQSSAAGLRAV